MCVVVICPSIKADPTRGDRQAEASWAKLEIEIEPSQAHFLSSWAKLGLAQFEVRAWLRESPTCWALDSWEPNPLGSKKKGSSGPKSRLGLYWEPRAFYALPRQFSRELLGLSTDTNGSQVGSLWERDLTAIFLNNFFLKKSINRGHSTLGSLPPNCQISQTLNLNSF